MRRRSTFGMGQGAAPVRLDTVIFPDTSAASKRVSMCPRPGSTARDSSGGCTARNLQSRRSNAIGNRQSISDVKVQSQGLRRRLYGNGPDPSTSILSGISLLGQSVLESNDCPSITTLDAAEDSKIKENPGTRSDRGVPLKLSDTKIVKPKVYSTTKKKGQSVSKLNSTSAFEEDEIAALTSTPRAEMVVRSRTTDMSKATTACADFSAVTEQMSLLLLDQRSAMQVMKLSFQKMNLLMDKQVELLGKQSDLISMQMKVFEKMDCQCLCSASKRGNVENSNNVGRAAMAESPESTTITMKMFLGEENPEILECDGKQDSVMENKENLAAPISKSLSLYRSMKSQMNCLKTPTTKQGILSQSNETPNTTLSNRVHNQLENLFETSETE